MARRPQSVEQLVQQTLGPLIEADGGELYIVEATEERLHLHLRGRFSGCAGNRLVIQRLIEPALRAISDSCIMDISSGELIPPSAKRWSALD